MKIMKTNSFVTICVLTLTLFVSGYQSTSFAASYQGYRSNNRNTFWYRKLRPPHSSPRKKVLLVGIDGLQFEKISQVSTPNLDKLKIVKAYTGGVKGSSSEQATNSGPGWTTILTGVWVDVHRVKNNSTSNRAYAQSIFKLIKTVNPSLKTASVVTWSPIHSFFDWQSSYIDYKSNSGGDANTVTQVVNHITNAHPDIIFAHLDDVDGVGHKDGFGGYWTTLPGLMSQKVSVWVSPEPYNGAIRTADRQFGQMIAAVERRVQTKNEDWLIIVTTDHGRGSGGYHHGGQTTQERTIFIGMNKPGNARFNSNANVAQTSVVPTILTWLKIPFKWWWRFAGKSLI